MAMFSQFYDKEGFIRSFDPEILIEMEEALNFYNTYGFVVLSNIFNDTECEFTKNSMWKIVEEDCPLLKGNDSSTWKEYTSSGKYGLSMKGPCFHPNLVRNRCKPKLLKAISKLFNLNQYYDDDDDRIMVGHDRFTIYRPTLMDSSFTTGAENIHLDMNPWWWYDINIETKSNGNPEERFDRHGGVAVGMETLKYYDEQKKKKKKNIKRNQFQDFIRENNFVANNVGNGQHIQAVFNFQDNHVEDGGTLVVPSFHKSCKNWAIEHQHLFKPLPWLVFDTLPTESLKFFKRDQSKTYELNADQSESMKAHGLLMKQAVRISMRAGSVLLWHQTTAHGTQPNQSLNPRLAQFCKFFVRGRDEKKEDQLEEDNVRYWPSPERLRRRALSLARALFKEDVLKVKSQDDFFGSDNNIVDDDDDNCLKISVKLATENENENENELNQNKDNTLILLLEASSSKSCEYEPLQHENGEANKQIMERMAWRVVRALGLDVLCKKDLLLLHQEVMDNNDDSYHHHNNNNNNNHTNGYNCCIDCEKEGIRKVEKIFLDLRLRVIK